MYMHIKFNIPTTCRLEVFRLGFVLPASELRLQGALAQCRQDRAAMNTDRHAAATQLLAEMKESYLELGHVERSSVRIQLLLLRRQ